MKIKILLFAKLREMVGKDLLEIELPEKATATEAFLAIWKDKDEALRFKKNLMFAINESYVEAETLLHEGDELALIPPVAGG